MSRPALTAIVPTRNEAANIGPCLDRLEWCDHRLVIDSQSDDDTADIARKHGAQVIVQPFLGYGAQRNRAVREAPTDWVLCIDADERCTPELGREIAALLASGPPRSGYRLRRRGWVGGHRIRRCGWQNDRVLRLYDRRSGAWDDRLVHERVELDGPIGDLRAPLDHFTAPDFAAFAAKSLHYAELGARELGRRGRTAGPLAPALYPLARFVKMYLLKGGLLDGVPGLVVCAVAAYGVFLKYALLWEQTGGAGDDPGAT